MSPPGRDDIDYAGFWLRVAAALIDSVLATAVILPLLILVYGKDYLLRMLGLAESASYFAGPAEVFLSYILPAVAIIVFWITRQATPGKSALSLKIVDAQTLGPLSKGQALGRYLGYYISTIPLCLGLLWVAFDLRKQGWHDKLAGTLVIKEQRR